MASGRPTLRAGSLRWRQPRGSRQRRLGPTLLATGVAAAVLIAMLVLVLALPSGGHQVAAPSSGALTSRATATGGGSAGVSLPVATVRIAMTGATRRVPRSFLGISTEYWTVPVWARHLSLLGRVFAALTADGPMVLRIGGSSADQTFWAPNKELPEWVFEVTPAWLKEMRRIVNRFGVRVILDLNHLLADPGPAPELVPLHLMADPSLRLKVWAVRSSPTTLHILLINKGRRTGRVSLHVAGAGPVSAQQMLAPSARAESGVSLDGQRLDTRGHWVGRPAAASIPLSAGAYAVTVRGQSPTLVTANVSPGAPRP